MNKRLALAAVAASGALIAAGALIFKSRNHPDDASGPSDNAGIGPATSDPAMTTESVPQINEEGVVPLPTPAVGRSPPEEKKQ